MKPTLPILLFSSIFSASLFGQDSMYATAKAKPIFGINITNTLGGFFNSGGQDLPKDPYLFSLKLLKDNKLWRLGANFGVDLTDEDVQNGGLRKVRETKFLLRLGREWEQPINKHFSLYYGGDVVGSFNRETSSFDFTSKLKSEKNTGGLGLGPFLGVYFKLGEHVRLSTETYAYGIFYAGKSRTNIGSGIPDEVNETRRFFLLPSIPNSLYIHFFF